MSLSSSGGTFILHHTPEFFLKFPYIWTWLAISHPSFHAFKVFPSLLFNSFLEEISGILNFPYGPQHVRPLRAICCFPWGGFVVHHCERGITEEREQNSLMAIREGIQMPVIMTWMPTHRNNKELTCLTSLTFSKYFL